MNPLATPRRPTTGGGGCFAPFNFQVRRLDGGLDLGEGLVFFFGFEQKIDSTLIFFFPDFDHKILS